MTQKTPASPEALARGYKNARGNLLLVVIFTVVNAFMAFMGSSSYFLFSAYLPYYSVIFGLVLTGRMDVGQEYQLDEKYLVYFVGFAVLVLGLYLLFWLFYGLQATVGYGITELYAKITGSDLTAATGFLAGFGFAFGPGQALSVGMSWQNDYGLPDCVSMGLAYAAAGFMVANFVGVPLANWGLRKGYATYGTKELSSDFLKGLRPEDKRVPACQLTTHSGNVDTFALHFAVAATVYGLGWIVCYVLKYFVLPPNYQTASFGFIYLYALFAGMIFRLVINHTAANAFYSDDAQNRILGTTIDYMIISALMAVSAATVMKYFIPFILVIAVCTLITLLGVLYLGRRVGSFGLERLLVVFGLVTGTAASGLALLRIVDSDFKTPRPLKWA